MKISFVGRGKERGGQGSMGNPSEIPPLDPDQLTPAERSTVRFLVTLGGSPESIREQLMAEFRKNPQRGEQIFSHVINLRNAIAHGRPVDISRANYS